MSNRRPCVRQTAAVLMAFGLILGLLPGFTAADLIEIHVAPTGDDAADGSLTTPVGSLIGARDAVRRVRAADNAGPVRVMVADGTYRFGEPLVLMPEDGGTTEAPVRYEAAPGARPVFSGGRAITGFRPAEDGLWVTVPGQSPRVFTDLAYANPGFKTLTWAGFSSNANAATPYYLDHFTLNARPGKTSPDLGEKP